MPVANGGGTLRLEVGSSGNLADEVALLGGVSGAGGLLKTYGASAFGGGVSNGSFTLGGNNSYTGPTTIAGAVNNTVTGTNTSSALNVTNGTAVLLGAAGSFGSVTAVRLVGNATLNLSDTGTLAAGASPAVAAAPLANRLGTAATLFLDGGNLILTGGTTADVTQAFTAVSVPSGTNRIILANGTGFKAIVSAGSLTVSPGGVVVVGGASVGTTATTTPTAQRLTFTTAPPLVNGILPGVFVAPAAGTTPAPTTFATYSASAGVGVVGLQASDYTTLALSTATSAVSVTTTAAVAASTSANAVRTSANINLSSGVTLTVGAGGLLTTAAVTVAGPGTLTFGANPGLLVANTSSTTYSGPITGTAGLVRSGSGTVILSGDLSGLSGPLVNTGVATLALNSAGGYAGPITLLGGTLTSTSTAVGTGGTLTVGNANTPAGVTGPATIATLNAAGLTTVARNLVSAGGDGTSPFTQANLGNVLTVLNAAQAYTGTVSLNTHLAVNLPAAAAAPTFGGVVSGAGGLEVVGSGGTVTLSNPANTFTGGVRVAAGTLVASAAGTLGTGPVRLAGGTVQANYSGALNGSTGTLTVLTGGTLNTGTNTVSVGGGLTGQDSSAAFTKAGVGTLVVNGSGSYAGPTTVAAGTLAGTTTLAGTVAVSGGAFVQGGDPVNAPQGTLTVAGGVTLAQNGGLQTAVTRTATNTLSASLLSVPTGVLNLAPGAGNAIAVRVLGSATNPMVAFETYTVTLATVGAAGNVQFNGASLGANGVVSPGNFTLSSDQFGQFSNVSLALDGTGTNLILVFTPVPEPATVLAVAGLGLGAVRLVRRRRATA